MDDLISRQAAIDALRDAENHAFNSYYRGLKEAHEIIEDLPSAQPEPTYCYYCHEDSDGFVHVLEKNGHAVIYDNKLMLAAKGWRGEVDIKYCPMCGRRLER